MPIVAVVNSNEDIVEMLCMALESAGITAVPGHVIDFKRGRADFRAFVEQHNPAVIVYDLAPPYRDNWQFLQELSHSEAGKNRRFVLTTTNKKKVAEAAGQDVDAFEISEKPYDIDAVIEAVKRQLRSAP